MSAATPTAVSAVGRKRASHFRRLLSVVLLGALLSLVSVAVFGVASGNWQVRPILSGSMRPGFPIGGVVVTQTVPMDTLQVGMVAVFHPPGQATITYVHRIIWLEHQGNQLLIRTKGDANPVRDPWTLHVHGRYAYVARFTVPLLGYGAVWLHSPTGRRDMLLVAGLAFLVCIATLLAEVVRRRRAVQSSETGKEPIPVHAMAPVSTSSASEGGNRASRRARHRRHSEVRGRERATGIEPA